MVPSDDNCACTSLLAFLHLIYFIKAFALVRCLELLSKVIVPDRACIHNRFWRKNVLYMSGVSDELVGT